ncbi:MAG: PEP-CTERM sorting domain-containing protein [Candidatus Accumulibacter meliphilus]|uniref:PEP-CTERM sorting domain-containing protein n=1 Tax=Candidatus Accumulibacter meliphilus TaxID=2211374 RepID=A0A369XKL9_9PROT|nr:MAG: PEP-CTERM sorting domain-containing protein [Candidatus Accumulibacter meliphilus]
MKSPWSHAFAIATAIVSWTWPSAAPAAVVTHLCASTNQFCTLEELVQRGHLNDPPLPLPGDQHPPSPYLEINGTRFYDWSIDDDSTVAPVDLSLIRVIPLDDQVLKPGFELVANGVLQTRGADQIDINFAFLISVGDGGSRIIGSSLELSAFEFGVKNLAEIVAVDSDVLATNGMAVLGEQNVLAYLSSPPSLLSDSITYPAQTQVLVETKIIVAGLKLQDTVALGSFTQRFSKLPAPIPEPPSLSILGLALLGLWGMMRRRSRP